MLTYVICFWQVSELQQVLTSMSHYVFQGGVISAQHKQQPGEIPFLYSIKRCVRIISMWQILVLQMLNNANN